MPSFLSEEAIHAFLVLELLFSKNLWQTEPSEPSQIGTSVPWSPLALDSKMVNRGGPPKREAKRPGPKKGESVQCVLGKKVFLSLNY
jgi:hypothetical protein